MEIKVDIQKKHPGFDLDIRFATQAKVLGILGASGAGKSMLLNCIAGLKTPDRGRIDLGGTTVYDSDRKINISSQKRRVGFLLQNYGLFPHMTVAENIGFALTGIGRTERSERVEDHLEWVRLQGSAHKYPHQLSGGQQQRAALARVLATRPRILLLDEPFSAVDRHLKSILIDQLTALLDRFEGKVIVVSHDIDELYRLSEDVLVINQGKVESFGTRETIFHSPPTKLVGLMTGCENFSRVHYISGNQLEALDWGIKLQIEDLDHNAEHIGIRGNAIRLATETDQYNIVKCWPHKVVDVSGGVRVLLTIGAESGQRAANPLLWEMAQSSWEALVSSVPPWHVYLDPQKLMVIRP